LAAGAGTDVPDEDCAGAAAVYLAGLRRHGMVAPGANYASYEVMEACEDAQEPPEVAE
jgi:hypothetical protein